MGWRALLLLSVYLSVNAVLAWYAVRSNLAAGFPDWQIWSEIPDGLAQGTLYEGGFRWSPIAAYLWLVLLPLGPVALVAAHFAALPLLGWPAALVALTFWGFWVDASAGNVFVFVVVAGVLAWRGHRGAEMVYLGMTLLMPRPVQMPLAMWLVWKRPHTRAPFAGLFTIHAVLVVASGHGAEWVRQLWGTTAAELAWLFPVNMAPSAFIGWWWIPIGLITGLIALWHGRLGWASLAVSPYWLPYYPLILLVDWTPRPWRYGKQDHLLDP